MRVLLKDELIVLVPENPAETEAAREWAADRDGHALRLRVSLASGALELHSHGPWDRVTGEPLNVVSNSTDPRARLISNFADTPFDLDGRHYESVESFWQALKFPESADRARVAALPGVRARQEGRAQAYGETLLYEGHPVPVGTWAHWRLMGRACEAKFGQNAGAREALLATGRRPLAHRTRRDSRTIPGVIMADIWMRIRARALMG